MLPAAARGDGGRTVAIDDLPAPGVNDRDRGAVTIRCGDRTRVVAVSSLRARAPVMAQVASTCTDDVIDVGAICTRDSRHVVAVLEYCSTGMLPAPHELAVFAEEFRFWGCAQAHPSYPELTMEPRADAMHFLRCLLNTAEEGPIPPQSQSSYVILPCSPDDTTVWQHAVVYRELLRSLAFTEYGLHLSLEIFDTVPLHEGDMRSTAEGDIIHSSFEVIDRFEVASKIVDTVEFDSRVVAKDNNARAYDRPMRKTLIHGDVAVRVSWDGNLNVDVTPLSKTGKEQDYSVVMFPALYVRSRFVQQSEIPYEMYLHGFDDIPDGTDSEAEVEAIERVVERVDEVYTRSENWCGVARLDRPCKHSLENKLYRMVEADPGLFVVMLEGCQRFCFEYRGHEKKADPVKVCRFSWWRLL